MDFLDYRKKLGLGFSDKQKFDLLYNKVFGALMAPTALGKRGHISSREYYTFCNTIGVLIDDNLLGYDNYSDHCENRFQACISIIKYHSNSLEELLLYYVSFVNSVSYDGEDCNRLFLTEYLKDMLKAAHIQCEILEDNQEFFVFPKGAEELDDALVSEPLQWLLDYPKAHATFVRALKQYSDGEHTRDVADNFRKALEEFLQEYLGNTKNLETNKNEICKHLGEKGVDGEFCAMLQPLLNTYKKINDKYAKHHDALDERLLEFVMYQTGVFIRMIISVKQ